MKRTRLPFLCLVASVVMGASSATMAQYNPAILPDQPYMTMGWPNSGTNPNNAVFDYALQTGAYWGGPYELKATAVDYNLSTTYSGVVYVDDNQGLGWYSFAIDQMTAGINVYPDVTICDNLSFYTYLWSNSFVVPVVFNDGGTIYLQMEVVYNAGGTWFGIVVTSPSPVQVSNPGVAIGAPHIDAESKYSTPTTWGSPTTDNVTITWEEVGGIIRAWSGSISSILALYPSIPTSLIGSGLGTYNNIYSVGNCSNPDVAMVERKVGGVLHDVALFTFVENTIPQRLHYAEWDITAGPLVAVSVRDIGTFDPPRIDAIDDYNYNNPAVPKAFYAIAVKATPVGMPFPSVWAYTNVMAPGVDVLNAVGLAGLEKPYSVSIACSPTDCSGSIASDHYGYTIQHWCTGMYTTYLAEQLNWNTGLVASTNYYEVPMNPVTGSTDAISSPNNEDGTISNPQYVYSGWDDGTYNVWTKLNQLCPFSFKESKPKPNPASFTVTALGNNMFSYKPAGIAEKTGEWSVSPNPVTDYVSLTAPQGVKIDGNDQYSLTDVVGREYVHSNINNQVERINMSNYVPGMYVLHVYRSGVEEKTIKIVKE